MSHKFSISSPDPVSLANTEMKTMKHRLIFLPCVLIWLFSLSCTGCAGDDIVSILDPSLAKLKKEAAKGSGSSAYDLYWYYTLRSQEKEKIKWLNIAIKRGYPKAYYGMAVELYANQRNPRAAKPWAEKAVQAKVLYSQSVLTAINKDIAEQDANSSRKKRR